MNSVLALVRWFWQKRVAVTVAAILLFLAAMIAATYLAFNPLTVEFDNQKTIVVGPTQFAPENPSAVRVVVRDLNDQPIANANVTVMLAPKGLGFPQTLYTGKTDARGTAPVSFTIPENTAREMNLVVETNSNVGRDRITKEITVQRSYKLLITTDKPLYQPGQLIHLRALALGALDRVPAKNQSIEFLIEDPKGNKVYRKTVQSSAYGIVSADFQLADTVNAGNYKITATLGDTKSEKTVNVKPYLLPKFKIVAETERTYYLPGERVTGKLRVDYFFGKPVAKGEVTIKGIVYDVARAETINLAGKTDDTGAYAFSFTLPNYFASSGLTKDRADFGLEISVTDQANHTEQTSLTLPIANGAIMIDAVPESGTLVANVENIVYVLTSLPDGSPLETELTISGAGAPLQAHAGKYGLAEIRFKPQYSNLTLAIAARDAKGRTVMRNIALRAEPTAQILLRANRATYRVGETMRLDAFVTGGAGSVFFDLIKEKQTFSTRAADANNGRASVDIDVTPELAGTVQVHAYQVERDGTIKRDTRVVVVEHAGELNIAIKPDRDVYRPGEMSQVTFNVTNHEGKGVQSALGVTGVDEAVFALAEQDPGFAKLYFLLQNELLEPKYQVKGFALPEVVSYETAKPIELRTAQDLSARAAWANATPFDLTMRVNSLPEKQAAATKAERERFNNLFDALAVVLSIVPLLFGGFVMACLNAKNILGKAMAWWAGAFAIYFIVSPILVSGALVIGALMFYFKLGLLVLAMLGFAWIVALGFLVAHAIAKQDRRLQIAIALLVAYLILFGILGTFAGQVDLGGTRMLVILLTFLAGLAALVLLGGGLILQGEKTPGYAAIITTLLVIFTAILLWQMPNVSPLLRVMGNPAIYNPVGQLTGCASQTAAPTAAPAMQRAAATAAPAPTSAPAAEAQKATAAGQEPPRLRQYFPETLYVNPQVITDERGNATIEIPLADSITTWRLAAMASSQRGELGSASAGLRVFQDFFVDLDLPVALTQNDEISIPVAVYNYLPQTQKVQLQVEKQSWFQLQDDAEKSITIASNDIDVIYFRIKAMQFGMQRLKVTALGEKMSDAIQREIRVYPDGKPFELTQSNWLKGNTTQVVELPAQAIPGASRIEVKIFPGVMSQVVNGLDGLLRMPFG
ncbi:MAG: hypothetical protein HY868_12895 [Chloroflexi bacterium]|nr:hypothetical protein [Chloroflexota bacterium]